MSRKICFIVFIASLLTMPGCWRILVPVRTTWPSIPIPERDKVEIPLGIDTTSPEQLQLLNAAWAYQRQVKALEAAIKQHNENVTKHNEDVAKSIFGGK